MKIAFVHQESFFLSELSRQLRERLAGHAYLDWKAGTSAPATDIDALLVMGTFGRESMAAQPRLAFIQTTSAGYEGIDVAAATDLGIWVSSAPSGETGNAVSVAEWAILLMIGASRNLNRAIAIVHDRSIVPTTIATSLSGKTACIVGLGTIGRLLIERLRPFGMHFTGTDARPESAPDDVRAFSNERLHEAVAEADYVVVCAPGSKENENLIDGKIIAAMKRGTILVNIARGLLVDEVALLRALKSGHIAAVGLDVLKTEPADPNDPLLALPQALLTPHLAGATDLMLAGTVDFIERVIADIDAGTRPKSVLNEPGRPRRDLTSRT